MNARSALLTLLASFSLGVPTALACSVPVFRYALERWPADGYELRVFHKEPLSAEQSERIKTLADRASRGDLNTYVEVHDIADLPERIAAAPETDTWPWMALHLPAEAYHEEAVWSGPLTQANLDLVAQSPARTEIARQILEGTTTVWVVLSGAPEATREVRERLDAALAKAASLLELPEIEAEDAEKYLTRDGPPLKIDFQVLEVDRHDPREAVFVQTLLGGHADLPAADVPLVIPVFGQGRALAILLPEHVVEDAILDAAAFLTGPCSCQVKALNPGFDLLFGVNWMDVMGGYVDLAAALPSLPGPDALAALGDVGELSEALGSGPGISVATMPGAPSAVGVGPVLLLAGGAVGVLVLGAGWLLLAGKGKE